MDLLLKPVKKPHFNVEIKGEHLKIDGETVQNLFAHRKQGEIHIVFKCDCKKARKRFMQDGELTLSIFSPSMPPVQLIVGDTIAAQIQAEEKEGC